MPAFTENSLDIDLYGDLDTQEGSDIPLITGADNYRYAVQNVLTTARGTIRHNEAFGWALAQYYGLATSPENLQRIQTELTEALLKDPYLADAVVKVTAKGAGTLLVRVAITTAYGEKLSMKFKVD